MRITSIVNMADTSPTEAPAPEAPPSAAHAALGDFLGSLIEQASSTAAPVPALRIMTGILPVALRDMATVPEEQLRRVCRSFGEQLLAIAHAGEVDK